MQFRTEEMMVVNASTPAEAKRKAEELANAYCPAVIPDQPDQDVDCTAMEAVEVSEPALERDERENLSETDAYSEENGIE